MSPKRHATATDVARLAGVSQSAVSRAFTPGASIAAETRACVVDAARRLGYHLLLFTPDPGRHAGPQPEEVLAWRGDALILASTTLSSALAEQCRAAGA